ncbi:histidinol-phosphate transaminase [Lentibacillus amyloliquefaciens]|uniref:Histidinol-phosphate aminotransferase n=1 Tax=Lentibacillus amyloliquefaciens TaxID=1472767 RepID=A0A0U4FQ24_9BACI|nr:histidinol-phosphate transaminase [Lentibacillus amyloliquefaciens]ALX47957.1 histidinol-phosphate aminotransferase [Lentibacillus amyloliquefaciens]
MRSKPILRNMTPYKPGKQTEDVKKEYGLSRIVKLASNENPFGFSEKVADYISNHKAPLNIYPDGYTTKLRTALAEKLNISEDQLIFGNGTDEVVQLIGRAYLYPGANTVMATPTFPQYKHNALVEGAEVKEIPTVRGYHDLPKMLETIDENTNVVWLCSPNNPTGALIPPDEFYAFMENCPSDVLVVLDEAYFEYVEEEQRLNSLETIHRYENLIVLRTFSKAYGLAGLRIGYGVANQSLIPSLDVVRGPFNTSSIAQNAAILALEDDEFLETSISRNRTIKKSFEKSLDSIGWHYFDSQTNFLLISTPISGDDTFQYLLKNGFIVRPGEGLGAPNTIRLTIGDETDMEELQELLYTLDRKISEGLEL